jgi:micrococcal nuclease
MKKISAKIFYFLIFLFFISFLLNVVFIYKEIQRNKVVYVADGDSFELASGQRVRLLGVNSPESGRCMYNEAKQRLTNLLMHRTVRLKDTNMDTYGRTLANVILDSTVPEWLTYMKQRFIDHKVNPGIAMINRVMIEEGYGRFNGSTSPYETILSQAQQRAKSQRLGIWSSTCRAPPPPPGCEIKGNIRQGVKTYFPPGCKNYDQVIIDTSFGDQWFCSEIEAQTAGFTKPSGC